MRRMESTRRWDGKPRITASDVVVWLVVTGMMFFILLLACALVTLVA